ncbi:MAG: tRNA dihydrouridine(20/20a) synthase DusA [Pseudomonadales bacterium]|nr:tRNA dihydrouridine(20/20a) synthase DusA [Pseudomonadales bacterium]MCP5185223.1 tRNA dihydrouridine(20/20a) synthase DusA [Pseudomonadales bacterium]
MMAYTDRHCRYLLRLVSPSVGLFTEMVTTDALLHGQPDRRLAYHPHEHPVALQLGGNDPQALAHCAQLAAQAGYDEVNLNVGCPSERVQQGLIGACLMAQPELVARAVAAMRDRVSIPVTVKCRLGIDDQVSDNFLDSFVGAVASAGCETFYVHARIALLNGLSPAQNRSIPPLRHDRVLALKRRFPQLSIVLNGGIADASQAAALLRDCDGVMIGRAAYHNPMLLRQLHLRLHPDRETDSLEPAQLVSAFLPYMERQLALGIPLKAMSRHLLGLFNGQRGARAYRRLLSDQKRLAENRLGLVSEALSCVC